MAFTANEGTETAIYSVENAGTEIGIVKLDIGAGSATGDFGGSLTSLGKGTITRVEGGTLDSVGVGSIANLGVVHNAGTIAALPDPVGSVVMTVGTVSAIGADLPGGTIDAVTSVANVVKGTVTRVEGGTVGRVDDVGSVAAVGQIHNAGTIASLPDPVGSVVVTVGTVSAIGADLPGGTIDQITFGTVDTFYRHPDAFATTVNTGTSTLGTIKAAVSGSVIYVTDVKISVNAASNVEIASGGTSTPIIGTLFFAGSGGMVANYRTPIPTASGSALVYKQSANTGMTIDVQGYVD